MFNVIDIIENYFCLVIDNNKEESILEPHLTKFFPLLKVKIKKNIIKMYRKLDPKHTFSLEDLIES